jgi:hypothetical protein
LATKAAASAKPFLGAWSGRQVHPVAGVAFFDAAQLNPLQLEFDADQRIQIRSADDEVTA